ncbi:hypothetical protein Trydic_g15347 [Trypoxylus dichotomus]
MEFGLQLDETSDSNKTRTPYFLLRFLDNNVIVEDLLFCKSIIGSAKAQYLLKMLEVYSRKNFGWEKCIGLCTGKVRSLLVIANGTKVPHAMWTYCIVEVDKSSIEFDRRTCRRSSKLHEN